MRICVFAAGALVLASCATPEMSAMSASTGTQQATTTDREAPTPPALRTPRQRSAVGWPDIGYRPYGN